MLDAGNIREKILSLLPWLWPCTHTFCPFYWSSSHLWFCFYYALVCDRFSGHECIFLAIFIPHLCQSPCPDFYCPSEPLPRPTEARTKIPLWGSGQTVPTLTKKVEIHSLPHLITVLSNSKRKNTALYALVFQPEAGSTAFWPIPGQPLRVTCQVIPPKCPVRLKRIVELSGPPPDECRAPETE